MQKPRRGTKGETISAEEIASSSQASVGKDKECVDGDEESLISDWLDLNKNKPTTERTMVGYKKA